MVHMNSALQERFSTWQISEKMSDLSLLIKDYSDILHSIGLEYKPCEYYWQVGTIDTVQGWIIHLSVVRIQVIELLKLIIPLLVSENIPFKIVRDEYTAQLLTDGKLGYENLGKVICIYPGGAEVSVTLVKKLISLTNDFKGPKIPTDFYLGAIVYTRFGSYSPIMSDLPNGEKVKNIYNYKGELVPDPYSIPFLLPEGISWPFHEITEPITVKKSKLLNATYYPIITLKKDVKGSVVKALYFKKVWKINTCLIKEGRKNMFSDDSGRDIQDRLKWQFDLYDELKDEIPLPKIFDYFFENDNAYLVMEFIKGKSLTNWVCDIYKDQSWFDLQNDLKMSIVEQALKIINIIQRLHQRGFVHRDITTENFLVSGTGEIILIDMELSWSNHSRPVISPFEGGTPGFMSPEQMETQTPTTKEDIYALGSVMIYLFTKLHPIKLSVLTQDQLRKSICFFIGDKEMADMISSCLESDPANRPDLSILETELEGYSKVLINRSRDKESTMNAKPSRDELTRVIQAGIFGLVRPELLSPKYRWLSRIQRKEARIGNEQVEVALYDGWQSGMAGPLWMVGLAKSAGFDVSECQRTYSASWNYIEDHFFKNPADTGSTLFRGGAGIALALSEGLRCGLLVPDDYSRERLELCFSQPTLRLSLSDGIAGIGIALLTAASWMEGISSRNLLLSCSELLFNSQQSTGSWKLQYSKKDKSNLLDFNNGMPGIIWFLLSYYQQFPEVQVKNAAIKALQWVINKTKGQRLKGLGKLNEALLFCKAFKIIGDDVYGELALRHLNSISPRPVIANFTLNNGLAALGELYLEAFEVFNDSKWAERADWITQIFLHSFLRTGSNNGYWIAEIESTVTADLFSGNSGILHYLIRYLEPNKMGHPFSPYNYSDIHKVSAFG